MFGCPLGCKRIRRTHKLCVFQDILHHTCVLAAHGTVDDDCSRPFANGARRAYGNSAVNDGHSWSEKRYIASRLSNEVRDPKREADMHNVYTVTPLVWWR